jgi:hypothetical protein
MTVKELYDYITEQMSAEEALMHLLSGSIIEYEKLKFDSKEKSVHPLFIISMAAMDMGWQMAIEKGDGNVNGLVVGNEEYMNKILNEE